MNANQVPYEEKIVKRLLEVFTNDREHREELHKYSQQIPPVEHLQELLSVGFWASLQEEEGRQTLVSLAYVSPTDAHDPLIFEDSRPLSVERVVKLAPSLNHDQRAIGVTPSNSGSLEVWGTARLGRGNVIINAIGPGRLVVRHLGGNLMVFRAGELTFLDYEDYKTLLDFINASFIKHSPFDNPYDLSMSIFGIVRYLLRQGHGGTLIVIPAGNANWKSHIDTVRYKCTPPFRMVRQTVDRLTERDEYPFVSEYGSLSLGFEHTLKVSLETVGQLTAVDGATIIDTNLEVVEFGAMLQKGSKEIEREILWTVPDKTLEPNIKGQIEDLGGARHQSAAEFCCREPDARAFVASQDGSLTVMGWDTSENKLFALRHAELYLL